MSKNFDETVCLQSEKRQEWIREIKGERPQEIAEGASSAPRLANSSAAPFPGKTSVRGPTAARLNRRRGNTVPTRSATKIEIRGKMEETTGWRGRNKSQIEEEEKRNGRVVGAAETIRDRGKWRTFQRKNLNILGLLKRKECPQCHRESSRKYTGAALAKRKRNRVVCPEYQIMRGERLKVGESRTLTRGKGIRARAQRGKGGLHRERRQIPSRRKHERVSRRKSSSGRSAESWFYS